MPWKEKTMDEKARFVFEVEYSSHSFSELCQRYGIARKTGYKWYARFRDCGLAGLADQSRAPRSIANRTPQWIVDLLVAERKRHPTWGPAKLVEILKVQHGIQAPPAVSTAALILKKKGLSKKRRRRTDAKVKRWGKLTKPTRPNEVWTTDFKGWFRTKDGTKCYPLTICDLFSRFILCCNAQEGTTTKETGQSFEEIFQQYGVPTAIRVDNGIPFSSRALGGLSRLSVNWLKLGIRVEFIQPGHPEQNGCHERMHKTLKQEAVVPPERNLREQQKRFDVWREEFNTVRPHEALDMKPPAAVYVRNDQRYPGEIPEFEYPKWYETRRVINNGYIRWQGRFIYLGEPFDQSTVGLRPENDDLYLVYAGPIVLGKLEAGSEGLRRPSEPET